jgi:hypothetical protein
MQACGSERLACLYAAGDAFAQAALGLQRNQRCVGLRFVALLYRCLEGSKLFGLHLSLCLYPASDLL